MGTARKRPTEGAIRPLPHPSLTTLGQIHGHARTPTNHHALAIPWGHTHELPCLPS
jgi:hypothetical protein